MSVLDETQSAIDLHFLQLAMTQARLAEHIGEVPVGAVLVDADNTLIAQAHNQPITLHDPTAHAEVICLRRAGEQVNNYRLVNTTMYVTLEPCPMCISAMVHARVARVVFACRDLRTGACGTVMNLAQCSDLNHQIVSDFIEITEVKLMLQAFFRQRR